MWEKLKKFFSGKLKRTAEKNTGLDSTCNPEQLNNETIAQSGFTDSEFSADTGDKNADDAARHDAPYHSTSDYCMIRPDASFDAEDNTTNSQSS